MTGAPHFAGNKNIGDARSRVNPLISFYRQYHDIAAQISKQSQARAIDGCASPAVASLFCGQERY